MRRLHDQNYYGPNGQRAHYYLAMSACRSTTEADAESRSGPGWFPVCSGRASFFHTYLGLMAVGLVVSQVFLSVPVVFCFSSKF